MPRQMRNDAFRVDQQMRLHEPHIAPITTYIDSLRSSGLWLPYVAPLHGGINARMLTVLRDPGPRTRDEGGSGMLCVENDDQTAANQYRLMADADLTPGDFTPWNAYPWYINRAPSTAELREASHTLVGLLELLPRLEVVLLQGNEAQAAWRIALDAQPMIRRRGLITLETYHPSNQALQAASAAERERRRAHRANMWAEAATFLRDGLRDIPMPRSPGAAPA